MIEEKGDLIFGRVEAMNRWLDLVAYPARYGVGKVIEERVAKPAEWSIRPVFLMLRRSAPGFDFSEEERAFRSKKYSTIILLEKEMRK